MSETQDETGRQDDALELLTFTLGGQDYAIDIMLVREIKNWSKPTPLPQTPDYVRGVINLRGTVLPILDLSLRLGVESAAQGSRTVYIVVHAGDRLFGVTVDGVSDILTVPKEALQDAPSLRGEAPGAGLVRGLIVEDERIIRVLAAETLAPSVGASEGRPDAA
ncbi:MAG: chemotaxis protein CheW [Pseudomonadota bacterium]